MAQIIYTGIVINIDYAGHPNMAQIRIPKLHGFPMEITELSKTAKSSKLSRRLFDYCKYTNDKSNTMLTIDKDLPWFPICYNFGSTIGPVQGDIVYIILENTESIDGLIVGWTGNQMVYQSSGSALLDSELGEAVGTMQYITASTLDTITNKVKK